MECILPSIWAGQSSQAYDEKAPRWAELPPELLSSVVRSACKEDLRSMHLACKTWRQAVKLYCDNLSVKRIDADVVVSGAFPSLRTLRVHGSALAPCHAKALAAMSDLRQLSLHGCAFESPASSILSLVGSSNLKTLDLTDVAGVTAEELDVLLSELPALTRLAVTTTNAGFQLSHGTSIRLPTFENLESLTGLTSLVVHDCQHRQALTALTRLSSLRRLAHVSLHRVGADNAVCHVLGMLPGTLRHVSMPDAYRVGDHGVRSLCALTGLTRLDLSTNLLHHPGSGGSPTLTNFGLERLPQLLRLQHLDLSGQSGLRPTGLTALGDLTCLTTLRLHGVPLAGEGCSFLSSLARLEVLDLGRTCAAEEHLTALGTLHALTWLDLSFNPIGDSGVAALGALRTLRHADVSFCLAGNVGMRALSAGCPDLQVLIADGCQLSTACVWHLLGSHPGLRMWADHKEQTLPRWFNAADALLFAKPQPAVRSLRIMHKGEDTAGATLLVAIGVMVFFIVYLVAVLLLLMAVLALPVVLLLGLGLCAACTTVLGRRWGARGLERIIRVGQLCWQALARGVEADLREAEEQVDGPLLV